MSIRVASSSLIAGSVVVGDPGHGVLGSLIPATGEHGAGYAYSSLELPADASKEIRGLITTWPTLGTLFAFEDTSFIYDGPSDTFAWQMYVDSAPVGSPQTVTITVGAAPSVVDIAAIGVSLASGTAGLVANVSISASALAQAAGSAGLSAEVFLAGSAAAAASGNAGLSAELAFLAAGAAEASGAAALTGGSAGDLSAVGGAVASGAAGLLLTVSLSGLGSAVAAGSASLEVADADALAAAGSVVASGAAGLVATVALTAAGFVQAMGAGTLAVQVPVSAAGGAVAGGAGALSGAGVLLLVRDARYWVEDRRLFRCWDARTFRVCAAWPRGL